MMKKYTDILKEVKQYFYLYCSICKEACIDDLYYLRAQKFCPKCGSIPCIIRSDKLLTKEEVIKHAESHIKEQKLNNIRKNNLIIE